MSRRHETGSFRGAKKRVWVGTLAPASTQEHKGAQDGVSLAQGECHGVAVVNDTEEKPGASPDVHREKSQWNGLDPPKIVNPSSSQKQDDSIPWNGLDPPKPASFSLDRESIPWNGLDPPTPVRAVKPVGGTVCELSCSDNKEKQEQESWKLEQLLSTYQDVFAKSDFDLGDFTAVSHSIDTGRAAPIKPGLRRTPLHFRGEEDGHLNKMLTAGDPTRA